MRRSTALVLGTLFLAAAVGRAAENYTKEDMPRFLTNLKSEDAKVRIAACNGIAEVGEIKAAYAKEAVEPLLELLQKDEETKVRVAAAIALGRIEADAAKTIPVLIETVKSDKERIVVTAAVSSLGVYGKEAKDALPMLKELAAKVRDEANEYRTELQKAQREMDMEKARMIQIKSGPTNELNRTLGVTLRVIQGQPLQ